MEVTVEVQCGRCKKTQARSLTLQEAQALEAKDGAKTELAAALPELINAALTDDHPDIIIAIRQPEGTYNVESLDNLCDAPDKKRNKGCASRVSFLLGDILMTNPPPEKKKAPAPSKGKGKGNGKGNAGK